VKNPSSGRGTTGSAAADIPSARRLAPLTFRIVSLVRLRAGGAKVAAGRFEVEGLGQFGFAVFSRRDGGFFVSPESVRIRIDAYVRTFALEDEFSEELLSAAMQRFAADDEPA